MEIFKMWQNSNIMKHSTKANCMNEEIKNIFFSPNTLIILARSILYPQII